MRYREDHKATEKYKREYLNGINHIIECRQRDAQLTRNKYIKDIFKNQEEYRDDLKTMLGWPLVENDTNKLPDVTTEKLSDEDGYSIYRMQFEILDGLKLTGLFFKMDGEEKKPLVIVQHGRLGTPEIISGFYGDTGNYNDMLKRIIKHGVHAFVPQLLLWNNEVYGVEYDRTEIDARLKRVGSSITAIEIYGIVKILDYFEKENYVSNFGMVGLSYGGFYTLLTSAIDTRIKSSISCSYFNNRDFYRHSDWTWFKSAEMFDDAEIACMVYPRRLCIEIGVNDEIFDYRYGVESFEMVKQISEECQQEWINLITFGGTHEFCMEDEPIQRLVNDIMN